MAKKTKAPKKLYRCDRNGNMEQYTIIPGVTHLISNSGGMFTAHGTARTNIFKGFATKKQAQKRAMIAAMFTIKEMERIIKNIKGDK